jgi:hypothetical protein
MTAHARNITAVTSPSVLDVFVARAEARAILYRLDEMTLHEAVDGLQQAAVDSGLVAELGQDAVQRIMATIFHWGRGR